MKRGLTIPLIIILFLTILTIQIAEARTPCKENIKPMVNGVCPAGCTKFAITSLCQCGDTSECHICGTLPLGEFSISSLSINDPCEGENLATCESTYYTHPLEGKKSCIYYASSDVCKTWGTCKSCEDVDRDGYAAEWAFTGTPPLYDPNSGSYGTLSDARAAGCISDTPDCKDDSYIEHPGQIFGLDNDEDGRISLANLWFCEKGHGNQILVNPRAPLLGIVDCDDNNPNLLTGNDIYPIGAGACPYCAIATNNWRKASDEFAEKYSVYVDTGYFSTEEPLIPSGSVDPPSDMIEELTVKITKIKETRNRCTNLKFGKWKVKVDGRPPLPWNNEWRISVTVKREFQ